MTDVTTSIATLADNWPYSFQDPTRNTELRTLLSAFVEDFQLVNQSITELHTNQYIDTATGQELANLGAAIGLTREDGESDASFRYRLQVGMAVAASDGTAADIESVMAVAFGEDALDSITVEVATDAPELLFIVDPQRIDQVPISKDRLERRLTEAMP
ncbi:hypothetical protein EXE42_15370, partial [Halorubrum sp. SP3]